MKSFAYSVLQSESPTYSEYYGKMASEAADMRQTSLIDSDQGPRAANVLKHGETPEKAARSSEGVFQEKIIDHWHTLDIEEVA